MKLLGIDYGRAKIGVAVAEARLATPLLTLPNNDNLLDALAKVSRSEQVGKIICGIPEGELAREVESFAQKLQEHLGIVVELYPETLSTKEAIAKLRASGASRKKLHNDHMYAAALILEDYWEQKIV